MTRLPRRPGRVGSGPWARLRRRVYRRDKGVCGLCGHPAIFWQVHHVVHTEDGGTNDLSNLVTVCEPCHKAHHRKPLSPERQGWQDYIARLQTQVD